jgi:hypothetical protein
MAASAIVLTWFVFFTFGVSFFVMDQTIRVMTTSGAFTGAGAVNAVTAAVGYLVVVGSLGLLLWQAARYAAALTGGPAIHSGGAIAAGIIMSQALRRGSGSNQNNGPQGGGTVTQQTGPGYINTASQAGGSVVRGVAQGVTAAFQRGAQRGSSR